MPEPPTDSVFAREMSQHYEEVTSPDGQIIAAVAQGMITGLEFRPDAYDRYSETELQHQLTQLARLAWVSRARARKDALQAAMGEGVEIRNRQAESPTERRLWADRDNETVKAESAYMAIRIKGGTKWHVQIQPGTIQALPEEFFLRELGQLVQQVMSMWRTHMNMLRRKNHGPSEILRGLRNSPR